MPYWRRNCAGQKLPMMEAQKAMFSAAKEENPARVRRYQKAKARKVLLRSRKSASYENCAPIGAATSPRMKFTFPPSPMELAAAPTREVRSARRRGQQNARRWARNF